MKLNRIDELDYVILPGRPSDDQGAIDLYNRAYEFWGSFWGKVLDEVGGDRRQLRADEFMRQDYINLFTANGEVVGLHAYMVCDLRYQPTLEHSYFAKYVTPESAARLARLKSSRIMTMEYFSIKPEWRASKVGVALGTVIGGLGLKIAWALDLAGVVTAARVDVGAANMAYDLGAEPVQKGMQVFGKPTDLVLWTPENETPSSHEVVNRVTAELWSRRIDLSGVTIDTNDAVKIAA